MGNGGSQPHQARAELEEIECQPEDEDEDTNERRHITQQQGIGQPAVYLPDSRGGSLAAVVVLVLDVVIVLGLDVGDRSEEEDDGQDEDHHRHARVRNPKRLGAGALAGGIRAVEEHAAGDRAEDPADAVAGLGGIDARGGVAGGPSTVV